MTTPNDAGHRPAGSQFSLRGMFVLLTATSVMFAVLALVIRSPLHWLGALLVPVICAALIGLIELGRRLFPPPPKRYLTLRDVPPVADISFPLPRPVDYTDGGCPFGPLPPETDNSD